MSEQPRDWDKEMAEIDKAIAKQPAPSPAPPGPAARAPGAPGAAAPPRPVRASRGAVAKTWMLVLLAAALSAALLFWPWVNSCGLGLIGYLATIGLVVLLGLWAASASWRNHRGFAHVVSLFAVLWGLGMAAYVVLPRIGYAQQVAHWECQVQPAADR